MTKIGYLLRTFPVLSETFVTGEIRGIAEYGGYTPYVAALYRPGEGTAGGWDEAADGPVQYYREIDKSRIGGILQAHATYLLRSPRAALRHLAGSSVQASGGTLPESRSADGILSVADRVKVARLARDMEGAGVTHLHTHFAWEQVDFLRAIKRLTGIPYSVMLHAADIFVDAELVAQRLADAAFVTTISEYNRKLLIENFHLPEDKVHVVRCGIVPQPEETPQVHGEDIREIPLNASVCSNCNDAEKIIETKKILRIISVGRMVEKKGFDVLLRALANLKERSVPFCAEVVGDGPLLEELQQQAVALGLELGQESQAEMKATCDVVFTGSLASAEVLQRMRGCDVFALCCKRAANGDMDGIPVVLMEAMSLGKPVVTTRLSGIPELVTPSCGSLAEPDDPDAIAIQLEALAGSAELRREYGEAGRRNVLQEFVRERQVRSLLTLAAQYAEGGR